MNRESASAPAAPGSPTLRDDQPAHDTGLLDTLQAALAGCRTEAAVYGAAVHRVAAALAADMACLAAYDPIAGKLDILHQTRSKRVWDLEVLFQAVIEGRVASAGDVMAAPIILRGEPDGDGSVAAGGYPWGVIAVACPPAASSSTAAYGVAEPGHPSPAERVAGELRRHLLRAAADRIAVELERRRVYLLDDVLDGLLRKTKPIDVYTHALRQLRRFIRYDHSASVMTMQPGTPQITVRVEKVVGPRGETQTLVDSPRRGHAVRLTAAQMRYLNRLDRGIELSNDEHGWHVVGAADPDAAGLWRALCLNGTSGERSMLCYPLIFGGQMLGILRLAAQRPGAFEPVGRYTRLLDRFARLLAVTLYRSELYHQSDRQLQAIKEIGRTITQPMPVEQICRHVLQLAMRVLRVQVGAVGLLGGEDTLELVAHHGSTQAALPVLRLGEGIAGGVVLTGTSRAVPDVTREPGYVVFNGRVRSELVAPITYDREVIGFLDVESFEEGRFREEDEEVITFLEALANQAAIAIRAAQLRSEAMERLGSTMAIDPQLSMAGLQDLLIDELRNKIEQLAATNERLAAANRAKSEFLAHMSHDLRGPLNVIVGLSSLLADPAVAPTLSAEKQQESLNLIRSNGEVLGSLIGNILDLAAVEAGKVELEVSTFAAAPAFEYLRAVATTLAAEHHKELEVHVGVDPALSGIWADEDKFLRIMHNLISNALKFTPSGGRVSVMAGVDRDPDDVEHEPVAGIATPSEERAAAGLTEHGAGRANLRVTVRDTGIGIAPDEQAGIFEAFQQVDNPTARHYHGTGLGLTVVRQFVELHGGRVWVESAPGEGSAFHVVLPGAAETTASAPPGLLREAVESDLPPPSPATSLSVLIVEDIPAQLNTLQLAVASRGHTAHGVGSGEEALAWLAEHRPDVILLDMQLPGLDGFAVAERLKSQVETHAIPIIAVSADALTVTEERALASGCDAYLTKPIDTTALLTTAERIAARP